MITARRRLLFQPQRYESVEVEFIVSEIANDTDPDEISRHLDELMAPEVHRVNEVASSMGNEDTSVYSWKQIIEQTVEGA